MKWGKRGCGVPRGEVRGRKRGGEISGGELRWDAGRQCEEKWGKVRWCNVRRGELRDERRRCEGRQREAMWVEVRDGNVRGGKLVEARWGTVRWVEVMLGEVRWGVARHFQVKWYKIRWGDGRWAEVWRGEVRRSEIWWDEARLGEVKWGEVTYLPTILPTDLPPPHTYTWFRPLPGLPFLVPIVFVSVWAETTFCSVSVHCKGRFGTHWSPFR